MQLAGLGVVLLVLLGGVFVAGVRMGRQAAGPTPTPSSPATPTETPGDAADLEARVRSILARHRVPWIERAGARGLEVVPSEAGRAAWREAYGELAGETGVRRADGDWLVLGDTVAIRPPASGWLVLVIDDVGFRRDRIERMLGWDVPVIFSILPHRPHARVLAERIRSADQTVFLHQPMEPRGYPAVNPGTHALLLSQTAEEWRGLLEENVASLGGAVAGINNHMGSRFTADPDAMRVLGRWLDERGLFFLDSLTTEASLGKAVCRELGLVCLGRDVFLDHDRVDTFLQRQLRRWRQLAGGRGLAVAIGHPHVVTMDQIEAFIPAARAEGYEWVGFEHLRAYARRATRSG